MSIALNPIRGLASLAIAAAAWLGAPPGAWAQLAPAFVDKLSVDTAFVTGATSATDIAFSADGRALVTRKTGQIVVRHADGATAEIAYPFGGTLDTGSEKGLLGVVADPDVAENRAFYFYVSNGPTADKHRVYRAVLGEEQRYAHGRPGSGDRGVPRLRSGPGRTGQPRRRRDVHPRRPALRRRGRHRSQRYAADQQVRQLPQQGERKDPAREPRRHGPRRQPAGGPGVGERVQQRQRSLDDGRPRPAHLRLGLPQPLAPVGGSADRAALHRRRRRDHAGGDLDRRARPALRLSLRRGDPDLGQRRRHELLEHDPVAPVHAAGLLLPAHRRALRSPEG